MKPKDFKFVVEFTVSANWIEDGFDLDDERALAMLQNELPYAYGSELSARVVSRPNDNVVRKLQGYTPSK